MRSWSRLQEYHFAIAGGVEPYDEQVEVAEVKVKCDQQLPADLEPVEEKPVCQRRARLAPRGCSAPTPTPASC